MPEGRGSVARNISLGPRITSVRSIPPRTSIGRSVGGPRYGAASISQNRVRPAPKPLVPPIPRSVEPMVDIFDEGDRILIVAEVPGADERSIEVEVVDHTLKLRAAGKFRNYRGDVPLPGTMMPTGLAWTLNNGVINLRLARHGAEKDCHNQPPHR